ncbi:hypothetical protein [Sphingomonas sp.]|uniref:hypothetical protein n=1 Tax=Sphingomonas sp. TaxID=28214 RepID=UPI0035A97038
MISPDTANFVQPISRTQIDLVMHQILMRFVGRGKPFSIVQMSEDTNIPERKLESAKREPGDVEHRGLRLEEAMSIVSLFGIPAQNMVLSLMGTMAIPRDHAELDPGKLMALLSEGATEFVKRGVDGQYDRCDRAELQKWADGLIAALTPFSSKAG